MRRSYFNIVLDVVSLEDALKYCADSLLGDTCRSVYFINAHCFNIAQKDSLYKDSVYGSDFVFNDGIGLKLGSYFAGVSLKDNLNGTDLIPEIIGICYRQNKSMYLLGGKNGVALAAKGVLEKKFNGIKIAGARHGFFTDDEEAAIIEGINDSKADVLIVGMGVPRQELWISKIKNKLNYVRMAIAGGAILDFISGNIERAPKWMRKNNIEWLYRLYLEPKRMWKRYIIGNCRFFYYILSYWIRLKK